MVVNNMAFGYVGRRRIAGPFERAIARTTDGFVTASMAAARRLSDVLHVEATAIPNMIREPSHIPDNEGARRALGIASHSRVAACLARLEPRKGHVVLLDAWEQSAALHDVLLLAGAGPLEKEIQQAVARLTDLGFDIRMLGQFADPWTLYAAADLTVLPSLFNEDMPLTLIEAMYAGRASISTDVAGTREIVEDGETGRLVPPADSVHLAAALTQLLRDSDATQRMGEAAARLYRQRFSTNSSLEKYGRLWQSLVKGGSRAQG
jgi:glycosyltransferase involved in cell wall biosynthesis